jgi:hypothetical protein
MTYPQQQFNQYGQQQPYQFQRPNLKIIPVTNRQEANSTQVDYSGVPTFFYNQTTGEIYKKQFDIQTGLATFQEYVKSDKPILNENEVLSSNTYKEELNAIMSRIDGLEETIRKMFEPKGVKNAK